MDWNAAAVELRKPLDRKHVASRKQAGQTLSYVEGWHVIAEANRIFGFDGWHRETVEMREVRPPEQVNGKWRVGFIAKVRVSVSGVVREGTGYGAGIAGDLGDAYESAVKEAETDAMKRGLMTFGNPFGLALYDKTRANVGDPEAVEAARKDDTEAASLIATMERASSLGEFRVALQRAPEHLKKRPDVKAAYKRLAPQMETAEMAATG